jgi:hypothetical protein
MGRSALIVFAAVLVILFLFSRGSSDGSPSDTASFGPSSTTTGHLSVVPTIRSVVVSPGSVEFQNCSGGSGATDSSGKQLGYPNGECSVGTIGINQTYPISVTYTGLPGQVYVSGTNAVPADGGTQWTLCNPQTQGQSSSCTGSQGLPGTDQYWLMNTASKVINASPLTTTASCDMEFDAGGGCSATPLEFGKQVQHEGLVLTGPKTWDDHSTSWTMTITWTAVSTSTGPGH